MADFFYWNKNGNDEGFAHFSVYLKNPSNNLPGWYFANPGTYTITRQDRSGTLFRKMPVKFGIHSRSAPADAPHKPKKMGKPGEYLVERSTGGLQIISEREFGLLFTENSSNLPGQKAAEASITIETVTPTGTSTRTLPPMGY